MINYLQVENLTKSYGDLVLFDNISFTIGEGQRIALIGRNGSGKTTLLNILAGKDTADSGTITPRRDLRIAYLEQNPEYAADLTVLEACFRSDNPALRAIAAYEQAVADPAQDGLQEAMSRMDALAAWDYEQRAKEILSRLKINDFDKKIGQLSGGQLKRVALAAVLISEADLLILDEPTNHLDTDMTEWLEEYLTRNKAALLMVTHDRYFLDNVVDRIFEFDGNGNLLQYEGGYTDYLEAKERRFGKLPEKAAQTAMAKTAASAAGTGKKDTGTATDTASGKEKNNDWKQNRPIRLKFTFKEQREYETIDDDIAALEEKIAFIDDQMMKNATNSAKLAELMAQKEETEAALEEKTERWVYLTDLAERIEEQNQK